MQLGEALKQRSFLWTGNFEKKGGESNAKTFLRDHGVRVCFRYALR